MAATTTATSVLANVPSQVAINLFGKNEDAKTSTESLSYLYAILGGSAAETIGVEYWLARKYPLTDANGNKIDLTKFVESSSRLQPPNNKMASTVLAAFLSPFIQWIWSPIPRAEFMKQVLASPFLPNVAINRVFEEFKPLLASSALHTELEKDFLRPPMPDQWKPGFIYNVNIDRSQFNDHNFEGMRMQFAAVATLARLIRAKKTASRVVLDELISNVTWDVHGFFLMAKVDDFEVFLQDLGAVVYITEAFFNHRELITSIFEILDGNPRYSEWFKLRFGLHGFNSESLPRNLSTRVNEWRKICKTSDRDFLGTSSISAIIIALDALLYSPRYDNVLKISTFHGGYEASSAFLASFWYSLLNPPQELATQGGAGQSLVVEGSKTSITRQIADMPLVDLETSAAGLMFRLPSVIR
jgi:hypothetical protein